MHDMNIILKERVRNAQRSLNGADPDYYLISVFDACLKRIEELEYENAKLREVILTHDSETHI